MKCEFTFSRVLFVETLCSLDQVYDLPKQILQEFSLVPKVIACWEAILMLITWLENPNVSDS